MGFWVYSDISLSVTTLTHVSCFPPYPWKKKTIMPVLQATTMGSKSIVVDGPLNYIVLCD